MRLSFAEMLTGRHPNSLGRTIEVVDIVLAAPEKLTELYQCYFSTDEIVRLRTSNALKRVCAEHPDWLVPFLDGLISDVSQIQQASTQWTLAQLFQSLSSYLSAAQKISAVTILQDNLAKSNDWIVLINTMQTLSEWAMTDQDLQVWLEPHLVALAKDERKSVSGRAKKLLAVLAKA